MLEAVGKKGTIFAHSANSVEIDNLKKLKLKENCKDLADKIDNVIERTQDSLIISRMNFYSPLMNGDWGVKSLIKAIPDCPINYQELDNIDGGDGAQLAWFIYTNKKTTEKEKKTQEKNLIEYCAKDTLALYYLIKFLMEKSKVLA